MSKRKYEEIHSLTSKAIKDSKLLNCVQGCQAFSYLDDAQKAIQEFVAVMPRSVIDVHFYDLINQSNQLLRKIDTNRNELTSGLKRAGFVPLNGIENKTNELWVDGNAYMECITSRDPRVNRGNPEPQFKVPQPVPSTSKCPK